MALTDVRLAIRGLLRDRAVTVLALASLALGIAANATIFSLVQAVEFPSFIYPDPSRLVFLESENASRALTEMPVSALDAADIMAAATTLHLVSAAADHSAILRGDRTPQRIGGRRVSEAFFAALGVPAAHGRTIGPGEAPDSIVLGNGLWRNAFGGDPAIVGRSIPINGGLVSVIGIMPPGFDNDADFWTPLRDAASSFARDDRQFSVFARLAPGVTLENANSELRAVSASLAMANPSTNAHWVTQAWPLARLHGRGSRSVFFLLQGAIGFVLLIACANIANLLLARGTGRRHEMALRTSLGASRGQLIRLLLTESLLLSCTGGAIGVVLSLWGVRLARAMGGFPDVITPSINMMVLAFIAGLAILTGILSGIVPALRASRVAPEAVMRTENQRTSAAHSRLRDALVVVQIASAVVLTTGAGLMLQTFANRAHVDLGFTPERALRADVSFFTGRYAEPVKVAARLTPALMQALAAQPDVQAAGAVTWALPTGAGAQRAIILPGDASAQLDPSVRRAVEAVTPGYFDAMGIPLVEGRAFTPADQAGTAPVAIINRELAGRLWPGRSPLGESLRLGSREEPAPIVTIVGVVDSIRRSAMHDSLVARAYVPFAHHPNGIMQVIVRGRSGVPPAGVLTSALAQADPWLLAEGVRSVEADINQFVEPTRLMTTLLVGFGGAGLLLAGLGVFGTMTYVVSQRARELAVRSALGANPRALSRLVLATGMRVVVAGLVPGTLLALATTQLLRAFLFGVSPTDPLTIAAAVALLGLVALVACYRPARTAATADPMAVLRRD